MFPLSSSSVAMFAEQTEVLKQWLIFGWNLLFGWKDKP